MKRKAKIFYISLDDFWRKEEKLAWLRDNPIEKIQFESITPDEKHNWINQTDNDFASLIPLFASDGEGLFNLFGNTIKTNRDDWVYDYDEKILVKKIEYFAQEFNKHRKTNGNDINKSENNIKWSGDLVSKLQNNQILIFDKNMIIRTSWRPFIIKSFYSEKIVNDRMTDNHYKAFGTALISDNIAINISDTNTGKPFSILATSRIADYHFISDTKFITLYQYDSENQKHENITDWGLTQFQNHYGESANAEARTTVRAFDAENNQSEAKKSTLTNVRVSASENGAKITKQDIFYYTYAVLHSPVYRKKYEQNLKREFPRLPFYEDFAQWRDWGESLMDLHINYETQKPFALGRKDLDLTAKKKIEQDNLFSNKAETENETFVAKPKTKLRADKEGGTIEIDSHTTLTGVPALAWEYKLGNRSALEWILDQYKEKKPSDATIAERFNTYRFEHYKEQVIDLLKRVTNVSVKTMEIVNQMPKSE